MSSERIIHGVVGIVLCGAYLYARRSSIPPSRHFPILLATLLGTWVPDWDLLIGIGFHRSPLTHSLLPALMVFAACRKFKSPSIFVGFALGCASHLLWDIVFYGDVRMISGGNSDRLFLLVNAAVLVVAALLVGRTIRPSTPRAEA